MTAKPPTARFVSGLSVILAFGICLAIAPQRHGGLVAVALADAGTVIVDDVTFDAGFAKYSAKHVEVSGSNLSADEFKNLLSGLAKGISAEGLAKLNAASIVIPDLALEETVAGSHQFAHYLDVRLSGIHAGKVDSYSIASGAIGGELADGQTLTATIHGMGGTGIDLPGLARVLIEASADADAPLTPLYDTAYAGGYEIKTSLFEMSIGKMLMSDIRGRPLKTPLADILKQLPKTHEAGQPFSPEEQKAALAFLPAFLDLYAAFSVGRMEIHDFKMSGHGDGTLPLPSFTASISSIAMTDYRNSRVGELAIDGLDVAPAAGKFHLGTFSLKGLDFRDALAGLSQLMQRAATAPTGVAPSEKDLKLLKTPRLDSLTFGDLVAEFSVPQETDNPSTRAKNMRIKVANYKMEPTLWPDGLPKSIATSLDHLVFDLLPNLPDADILADNGFDTLDLSFKIAVGWDEGTQRLTIDKARFVGEGLGTEDIAATLDNVPAEAFNSDQFARQAAWLGGLVKSLDVRIENAKLFDILLAIQARQTHKSTDDAKRDLITAAAVSIPQLLGNSPAAKQLADAVTKFLANPKSLHIMLTSRDGLGFADVVAPDHILDNVELSATANE